MAHDGRVVGQADVTRIVFVVVALWCCGLLLGDDEGALDVDAHCARVLYRLFNGRVGAMGRVPPGALCAGYKDIAVVAPGGGLHLAGV